MLLKLKLICCVVIASLLIIFSLNAVPPARSALRLKKLPASELANLEAQQGVQAKNSSSRIIRPESNLVDCRISTSRSSTSQPEISAGTEPRVKMYTETGGKAKVELPPPWNIVEAIELEVPQEDVVSGTELLVKGRVTSEFQEDYVNITLIAWGGRSRIDRTVKVDEKGFFQTFIGLSNSEGVKTGKYRLRAKAGNPMNVGYTSNTINVFVRPNIQRLAGIKFLKSYHSVAEGMTGLMDLRAIGFNKQWVITPPMFGTTYRLDDPSVAEVTEEGKILGKKAGKTVLHAFFNGYTATTTISVFPSAATVTPAPVESMNAERELQEKIRRMKAPQEPMPLQPGPNATFRVGETITFKVTPFDTSKGHTVTQTFWTITIGDSNTRAARLHDGTEMYAEWTPEKPGRYRWNMFTVYKDRLGNPGATEESPWTEFIVTD